MQCIYRVKSANDTKRAICRTSKASICWWWWSTGYHEYKYVYLYILISYFCSLVLKSGCWRCAVFGFDRKILWKSIWILLRVIAPKYQICVSHQSHQHKALLFTKLCWTNYLTVECDIVVPVSWNMHYHYCHCHI